MRHISTITFLTAALLFSASCSRNQDKFDASGSFEAEETIISAEAQGVLKAFDIEEGMDLQAGQHIGYIDSVQLYLKKKQLEAQIVAAIGKKPDITVQLSSLHEQLKTAETEKIRTQNLVKGDAATPKQLDDINAQVVVLKKQIEAQRSSLTISSEGINKDVIPLQIQIEQLEDQLNKCTLINPVNGTVLTKYAEVDEIATTGKPLYKIADLSEIILRVYITGDQLALVKLNQSVKVLTDDGKGAYNEAQGRVSWISSKAEFTPKTIQTKDERANMVYAIKVKVKNDGRYKIGMYGEIKFQ
ncbi:HlyD family secretion protein [Filimonas effusa]|uniref:HlyD family efflux transporter periplasmic adaptor subunit n=1 Tax=Filimonas effusa TaxID=2508721 RepID=A0A4Q1DCK7_9BACT|nr:efflux RND transporter periplasmic adaptor subunit [Filimonas effusa]RXK86585.1 HlyD family efflux transporter periplasmic adaptor subunit [Filimonas effusa]